MDAGGLAQMTYNTSFNNNGLGVPGSGFGSRGKGAHIKRLGVAPPKISTIDETQQANMIPTPRTSRSHMLAGLRTAPKSAHQPSTSFSHQGQSYGMENNYNSQGNYRSGNVMPQTAMGTGFSHSNNNQMEMNGYGQLYSLPEQVLAPPAIQINDEVGEEHVDPNLMAELVATNLYLAQQQQRLQQQLINVTAAAQQFHGLDMNSNNGYGGGGRQAYYQSQAAQNFMSNQQMHNQLQPIVQAVPGQPGLYTVYNPLTGQLTYVVDNAVQNPTPAQTEESMYPNLSHSPPPPTPTFHAQITPPPHEATVSPVHAYSRNSSPKTSPSPPHVNERVSPPTNSFSQRHKKSLSFAINTDFDNARPLPVKSAGYPQTPLTGTFGPGQARAGEHPLRQPRGPPSLDELIAKPTTKHEGSKNFATRQRRRAVHNLVRAGKERRSGAHSGDAGSASTTPASEVELAFPDNESLGSARLSSEASISSLRGSISGAIGSERKARSKERSSVDSQFTATSMSSDEGTNVGGKLLEIKIDDPKLPVSERRNTPKLVLTRAVSRAEKRKSSMF
ncbi:MAG: hypothetical protein M1834_006853 [Cirrosporium novae-zelandiae]|nr:MAG: hypothetical protein M1834_006853 [Cirrosporium novae-zelandiae]